MWMKLRSALGWPARFRIPSGQPALIDYRRLRVIAEGGASTYAGADPFPHIVIDDFLDRRVLDLAVKTFPGPEALHWTRRDAKAGGREVQFNKLDFALGGKDMDSELRLSPWLRYLLLEFNSATFLRFLQHLTGIAGLIADPGMWGGGLHQSARGGRLAIHADFLKHPTYGFDRRLNVLLFLNPHWRNEYGGALELWSQDMKTRVREILPIANRCVIFSTSAHSYHGHTKAIACPPQVTRKSIAMYYYTVPDAGVDPIGPVTHWQHAEVD